MVDKMNLLKKIVIGLATLFSVIWLIWFVITVMVSFSYAILSIGFLGIFLIISIPWIFLLLCWKFKDYKWLFLIDLLWLIDLTPIWVILFMLQIAV